MLIGQTVGRGWGGEGAGNNYCNNKVQLQVVGLQVLGTWGKYPVIKYDEML